MKTYCYIIRCITPLHVGSGNTNYGTIDNLVQRDDADGYPIIHGSSLKGGLREFFHRNRNGQISNRWINDVFGYNKRNKDTNDADDAQNAGSFIFDYGSLLCLPVRSNKFPFFRATTQNILAQLSIRIKNECSDKDETLLVALEKIVKLNFPEKANAMVWEIDLKDALLEKHSLKTTYQAADFTEAEKEAMTTLLGERIVILKDENFKEVAKHLQIIARNHLDNGISKNLWYEEVVPRESRFYALISEDNEYSADFQDMLTQHSVQLGGNATVGYGKCFFSLL